MARTKQNSSKDKSPYFWAAARIALGLTFLWAFFDKLFGLGFATCRDAATNTVTVMCGKAWVNGGSPTTGFLKFATKGPLAEFYQGLAGNAVVDILFMAGLLLIGLALVAGIGMRIATISGVLLMTMMWSALLLPENNPILDDHVIYSIVLLGLLASNGSQVWGLRNWWVKQSLVKRLPILE
jgi:thiosulfate dehydrogenase (quinone) large subunit